MNLRPDIPDLAPGEADALLNMLFDDERNVFIMLDAAVSPNLLERLQLHEREASCLVPSSTEDIAAVLPWVIRIERNDPLVVALFSDKMPFGLWSVDPGLFFLTELGLTELTRHLRKFHRPRVVETQKRLLLRYWEPGFLGQMLSADIPHIQGLVGPEVSVVARVGSDVYKFEANEQAWERPGHITQAEVEQVGRMLTTRRRALLAGKIAEAFPDHVAHLKPSAIEREVQDAWFAANDFQLRNGQIRAKFIITAVALAPGFHRYDAIEKLFRRSSDPDQTFKDYEAVMKRRFADIASEGVD